MAETLNDARLGQYALAEHVFRGCDVHTLKPDCEVQNDEVRLSLFASLIDVVFDDVSNWLTRSDDLIGWPWLS